MNSHKDPDAGSAPWVSIGAKVLDGNVRFAQDSSAGGFASPSIPMGVVDTSRWITMVLDVTDVSSTAVKIRARFGDDEVPIVNVTVPIEAPLEFFRVKCGIDDASVAGIVYVDDLSFETCRP
jgi:hypothetical protein